MDWPEHVQVFRVGGAVRDRLLGIPPRENDYVVVGASPALMNELGFRAVGKDFPVFLHPDSNEEYALARTERKQGHGYKGFLFHAEPDVTLQQDLERRDLTVNAIAEDEDGNLVDPFNGVGDLEQRILRHVSPAFIEDPLRVLRVAKFAARLHRFSFTIADETMELMRELAASGELDHLVAERVWQETRAALLCPAPQEFFRVLRECGALKVLFPELDALFGVPQPEKWHPEIDTGVHQLMVLEQVARLTDSLPARYAALVHDLGKGTTPPAEWPSHRGHEERGVKLVKQFSKRLKVPRDCLEAGVNVSKFHTHVHRAKELRADTIMRVIEGVGAIKDPQRMEDFLHACEADARGRTGLEEQPYPQADRFRRALAAASGIAAADVDIHGLEGAAIGEKIRRARVGAIRRALQELDKGID